MEIFDLKSSERMIEILSPGKKLPIGIRVTIVHIDDDKMKKLKRSIQDEASRLEQRGKFFKAEDVENNVFELTFAAMTGWEWYNPTGTEKDKGYDKDAQLTLNGDAHPPFTKKNVFEVFEKLPWFLKFITDEVANNEAFFPK